LRLLLDTHALVWWLTDDSALSPKASVTMRDAANQVFVSAATAWEIATKHRIGKFPQVASLVDNFAAVMTRERFVPLPVTVEHGIRAGSFAAQHRDPFDRMLVAQALAENMMLVSNESLFDAFGVSRLW
jgi:PIN domain nuclease of toxin-antitoxin system